MGAGPAGSACARALTQAGFDVLLLDKARFPREKLCAGWITPEVLSLLDLMPEDYERAGLHLSHLRSFVVWDDLGTEHVCRYDRTVSYGVIRAEFDRFLLERSGATIRDGVRVNTNTINRRDSQWLVDERFSAPILIGAGGHLCPVARRLGLRPPAKTAIACMELEIRLSMRDRERHVRYPDTPEFVFCDDLNGYGWYFNKGERVNIGVGRLGGRGVRRHLTNLLEQLQNKGRLPESEVFDLSRFGGHAYSLHLLNAGRRARNGCLLIGDAAGVAFNISGEGIRPAILSGRLAAQVVIDAGGVADEAVCRRYEHELHAALGRPLTGWRLALYNRMPRGCLRSLAKPLLRSDTLVRHLIIDRLFLRPGAAGLANVGRRFRPG